jgi:hypothetical protein
VVALGAPMSQRVLHWMMSSPDHAEETAVMAPTTGQTWDLSTEGLQKLGAMPATAVQRSAK